jgi:PEP-CTERM motif
MRRYSWSVFAVPVLAILIAPGAARGDTITPMFFDGFQADKTDVLDSTLVNWYITSGSIDVLSAGNLCGPAGDYSSCVDLDGTGALAGTIQTKQAFALDEGLYRLTFDLAGANRRWPGSASNTVTVSLGTYFSEDLTLLQYDPFQTFTRDIAIDSAGVANIVFHHYGSDWIGLLLDNVSLARVIPDVPDEPDVIRTPEPGSWELVASALGLLVWRFRKSRR